MRTLVPVRVSRRLVIVAAAALSSLLLSSCSTGGWIAGGAGALALFPATRLNHLYNGAHDKSDRDTTLATEPVNVRMATLECDEQGWFRRKGQARGILDTLQSLAARENVAIVLYVHGWRHNASRNDGDVRSFRGTLQYLGQELHRDDLLKMRRAISGDPHTKVYGIFVGWRGKAWPEIPVPVLNQLNFPTYFTFWTRKAAAGRVGHGDLRMFVRELDALQRAVNGRSQHGGRHPVMSLAMIGHSFGGHALFDATREGIEANLANSVVGAASALDGPVGTRLHPPSGVEPDTCRRIVRGLGDLVVLVNPAIEAASYHRIDQLVRGTRYRGDQKPVLVTVSARNDWSRNVLFTAGRFASHFGTAVQSRAQAHMLGHALGSFGPQLTHDMRLADDTPANRRRASRRVLDERPASDFSAPATPAAAQQESQQAVEQLKGERGPAREPAFIRLDPKSPDLVNKPAYVIQSDREVIDNHSDFFRVEFIRWLVDFVLDTQKERIEQAMKELKGDTAP